MPLEDHNAHKYFDLTVYNDSEEDMNVNFRATRDIPLYNNYAEVSICRFDMNNDSIPIFIPEIRQTNKLLDDWIASTKTSDNFTQAVDSNQLNANSTNLGFGITDSTHGHSTFQFIDWVPESIQSIPPHIPSEQETINNSYYYTFNTLHVLRLFENTVNKCIATLHKAALDSGLFNLDHWINLGTDSTALPKIRIVKQPTGVFFMIPATLKDLIPTISFHMNYPLHRLLPFFAVPYDNAAYTQKFKTLLIPDLDSTPTVSLNGTDYYALTTKYKSTSWHRFSRLVLKTSMPIYPELVSHSLKNDNRLTESVVTDFILNNGDEPDTMYDKLVFEPQINHFRPIILTPTNNKVDFNAQVFLKTPRGDEIPFKIQPGRYASMKLLFIQRSEEDDEE